MGKLTQLEKYRWYTWKSCLWQNRKMSQVVDKSRKVLVQVHLQVQVRF